MAPPRPIVLCILDGFGDRDAQEANAVKQARTPALDALYASCPHTLIDASGEAVGLPAGQMGNSEVGHIMLGAGRIVLSDRNRIDLAIRERKLSKNPVIDQTVRICLYDECRLHLFGLLSDGGVHSHIDHLFELIDIAHFNGIPVVVHAFLDGRDTPPRSAMDYIQALQAHIDGKDVVIGTLAGRYYAMDRDQRWERVYKAYRAIVRHKLNEEAAPQAPTPYEAIAESYANDISDEFVVPVRIGEYSGMKGDFMCDFTAPKPIWEWTGEEAGIAFNFRADRIRQLTAMLTRQDLPDEVARDLLMDRDKPMRAFREHCLATMTSYSDDLDVPVAFRKEAVVDSFGELVARVGLKQLRCAESEKYPHVTYFFNGGREDVFEGEERKLVPSPRLVDTYDEKPEMSAPKVAEIVASAVEGGGHDVIVVNFANPDMVGHTGKLDAAIAAVEAVDRAVGRIAEAVRKAGGAMIVTADHGNCEQMVDERGNPHTAHTTNLVPLIYLNERDKDARLREGGKLSDVAPTLLEIMELDQPAAMTGTSLRQRRDGRDG